MAHPTAVAEAVEMGMNPVPYACEECRSRGSPHGLLVFPVDGDWPTPQCRYHKEPVPMTRSRHYDAQGNRIKKENK